MSRSFLFLFGIVVIVAVAFVMMVGQMNAATPTDGVYGMTNQSANQTGQLLYQASNMAPNWIVPGIFVVMALLVISVLMLIGRRR